MVVHRIYGVEVHSPFPLFDTGLPSGPLAPVPGAPLRIEPCKGPPDDQAFREELALYEAHGRALLIHGDGAPERPGTRRRLCVVGVASFYWREGESVIQTRLAESGSESLLAFWLVHIILPLHLALERGWDFLHAAAVEIEGAPVLFVAPSMGGKSTLGDYFLKRGHPMLSDDKVATVRHQQQYVALPSHPHHRPFRQFEVLGLPIPHFAKQCGGIRALYVLERGAPDSEIDIVAVHGFRKFEALQDGYLFEFDFMRAQRLRWLASLADSSAVFRIRRPWDLERQDEVYKALCEHARALGGEEARTG